MAKYEWVASIAGSIGLTASFRLYYDIYKTKDTSTFTWWYLLLALFTQLLLVFYAYINGLIGILWPTIILILGYIFIMYVKYVYYKKDKLKKD